MNTVISVDGEDGMVLAKRTGIRPGQESLALVLRGGWQGTRNGQAGEDTPRAIRGGPGGTLAVQLFESNVSQGAIRVERVNYSSADQHPQSTEVPVGRNILFTATGGNGECGGNGGHGQNGYNGTDGVGASKASDATDGTDGGMGGDAGQGSNGADGGPGGALHIIVRESNLHLLMAISCDVKGGQGGGPGCHGKAGVGGKGGIGGQGWQWEDIVGYKPFCTDSCIKRDDYVPKSTIGHVSSALTRAGSRANASSSAFRAQLGALTVRGDTLPQMMQQVAIRHNALRQSQRIEGGEACHCGGGSADRCAGCDVKPITKRFTRDPGLDGKDGKNGTEITTLLSAGQPGESGTVNIAVHGDSGSIQEYDSVWSLELVDFEVEDENGDGVFEPGEHVFIRRIRVRNSGGMPSPTCQIPVTLASNSDWFEKVPSGEGGVAFLPTSIPVGGTASTSGAIKVRIKERTLKGGRSLTPGCKFSAKDTLRIRADIPWLDRKMPCFEFSKEIDISYPCAFGDFQHLRTVAQGAVSVVHCEIQNSGHRPLGELDHLGQQRVVEIRTTIPLSFGRLIHDSEHQEVIRRLPSIRPRDAVSMEQQFYVLSTAQCHRKFWVTFEIYIESPLQDPTSDMLETVLVESQTIQIQVSNAYNPTPNAKMLLIMNPNTTKKQSRAIQLFVTGQLMMEVDICNVHENGGLLSLPKDDSEELCPITTAYHGKTVIVLDNEFSYFDAGIRTTSHLWDPQWLSDVATNGNSSLFIGSKDDGALRRIIRSSVFPVTVELDDVVKEVPRARTFASSHEFVDFIKQETQFGNAKVHISAISMKRSKWYRMGLDSARKQAKSLAAHLCGILPAQRFLVSFVLHQHDADEENLRGQPTKANGPPEDGHLVILTGVDHHRTILSTDMSISTGVSNHANNTIDQLSPFFKYSIIAALPLVSRLNWLWATDESNSVITKAMTLSVQRDIYNQIKTFATSEHKPLISITEEKELDPFLKIHLPCLVTLFGAERARQSIPPPKAILTVLHWTLACAASAKPHKRLEGLIQWKIEHCPSTVGITFPRSDYIDVDMQSDYPESLLDDIATVTETPKSFFQTGELSAGKIVPRTRFCMPSEWNDMVRDIAEWRGMLKKDMDIAREKRDRMLVDVKPPEIAELSVT
ncbi:uncharacterized protein K460DRAFT_428134 [Cucurbitaria berberidis CBS 394.84]|uniref:DUF7932 domain-containing protein n=1 Tax=Cucurbitaria berberidis CBS 394.84 TaxID=1168544 RepID=A0A9P4GP61_9PLEO|nr:uncharacterized protein K460DRAFT_428134 [Cucurbitaria berberidis CBS 394.84]KAF1848784.1 hypothetical protein K460DRAFT_428134 [Cucurbitaria berberidis CBS 394.84]